MLYSCQGLQTWSQSELARRAGVTRQTINDYESMRRLEPDQKILVKISQALGFPPDHLPRLVGNLPPISSDPWLNKQNYKLSLITDPTLRETAERLINSLAEQEEAAAKSQLKHKRVAK